MQSQVYNNHCLPTRESEESLFISLIDNDPERIIKANPLEHSSFDRYIPKQIKTDYQDCEAIRFADLMADCDRLRVRNAKLQDKVHNMQCYQEEVEYLLKVNLLQSNEIDKLRRMLKTLKQPSLQTQQLPLKPLQLNSSIPAKNKHRNSTIIGRKACEEKEVVKHNRSVSIQAIKKRKMQKVGRIGKIE